MSVDVTRGSGWKVAGACAVVIALGMSAASGARAQSASPLRVSLGAGVAFPTGSTTYDLGTGYQLQGGLEARVAGPVALRGEALFNHFGFTYTPALPCALPGCSPTSGRERTLAGTVDALLQPTTASQPLVPYLIAGGGLYNHNDDACSACSGTDIGVNGGAGLRLPSLHAFAEVRAHVVKNAPNYVPIIVGVRF